MPMTLQGHQACVSTAVFSTDGQQVLAASDDDTSKIWSAATGECFLALDNNSPVLYAELALH